MQILQWLSTQEIESNSIPITPKHRGDHKDQTTKPKDIAVSSTRRRNRKRVETSKVKCENLSRLFCFLRTEDVSRPFFYHTLHLKRVGSFQKGRHCVGSMKMKKDDVVARICNRPDSVGNKVLPVTTDSDSDKVKGDTTKGISRMKELIKWAASAKGRKSGKLAIGRMVLSFKNNPGLKAEEDDDQYSTEPPKISFGWDMESCSTTSSVYSAISKASFSSKNEQVKRADASLNSSTTLVHVTNHFAADAKGNWITTDSEFVVLEL